MDFENIFYKQVRHRCEEEFTESVPLLIGNTLDILSDCYR